MPDNEQDASRQLAAAPASYLLTNPLPAGKESDHAGQRYHWLVQTVTDPVLVHDQERCVLANDAALKLFGARNETELASRPVEALLPWKARQGLVWKLYSDRRKTLFAERRLVRLDGTALEAMVAENSCCYQGKPAMQVLVRRAGQPSDLHPLNPLSGLSDRLRFGQRLQRALVSAIESKQQLALLRIAVNTLSPEDESRSKGHAHSTLRQIEHHLAQGIRDTDALGRLGSEEFGVVLGGLSHRLQASQVAQRLLDGLSSSISETQDARISFSIGIAIFPLDSGNHEHLMHCAGLALENARMHGKNSWRSDFRELQHRASTNTANSDSEIRQRYLRLTPRERQVLELIVAGKANKMIAHLLGLSSRTIENHRARIMDKMQARSLPALVQMTLSLRSDPLGDAQRQER